MNKLKLLFASDLHGSNICFLKLIALAKELQVNMVIIGGDLSGKFLIILESVKDDYIIVRKPWSNRQSIVKMNEFDVLKKEWGNKGHYYAFAPDHLADKVYSDDSLHNNLLRTAIRTRLTQWLTYSQTELSKSGITLSLIPGNDDPLDINEDINSVPWANNIDEISLTVGEWIFIGLGYSTPTPWKTPRELDESQIKEKLINTYNTIKNTDLHKVILVSHVPPKGIGLDIAPEVIVQNNELVTVPGSEKEVGSDSVKQIILEKKPLITLSGHCHDSAGIQFLQNTLCINAGSSYTNGILRAAQITLENSAVKNYQIFMR
ncbi:MAG: metallophosphoesterase [Ignavibacteriales bacterium]|nr:metallophosphoesterase [Ignavibacteriales bacterium]